MCSQVRIDGQIGMLDSPRNEIRDTRAPGCSSAERFVPAQQRWRMGFTTFTTWLRRMRTDAISAFKQTQRGDLWADAGQLTLCQRYEVGDQTVNGLLQVEP